MRISLSSINQQIAFLESQVTMMSSPIERIVGDTDRIFGDENEKRRFLRRLGKTIHRQPVNVSSPQEFRDSALRIDEYDDFPSSVERLLPLAEKSSTASGLLAGSLAALRGKEALDANDIRGAVIAYGFAYRKGSFLVRWTMDDFATIMPAFEAISNDASEETDIRADALFVRANILFLQNHVRQGLAELRAAQNLLPDEASFHTTEGSILAMQLQKQDSLAAFDRAADLGCDNMDDTLFHRAILTPFSEDERNFLEKYVALAEGDARKLPEACYRLSLFYGIMGPNHLGAARRFYDLGLKADKSRLPIFPDASSSLRKQARTLASKYNACGNLSCKRAACMLCKACRIVFYCSRECQTKEWKDHKTMCKKYKSESNRSTV
jgi:tetratricopeptide (TPR) repeat protein